MPIIGLSDEQSRNEAPVSYPLFAKVKKGDEKPKRGVGKNLPYFRFVWSDPVAEKAFVKRFGDNVDSIPIVTLGATVDSTFDTHYRMYTSNNSLQILCDGCTVKKASNRDLVGKPCICEPEKRDDDPKMCSMRGYLYFTIPELCMDVGYVGQFVLTTGSVNEIADMASLLQTVQNTVGTLEYQRFILRRYERAFDVDIDGSGKNKNVTQWMVELVPPIDNLIKDVRTPSLPSQTAPQLEAPKVDMETGEVFDDSPPEQTIPDEIIDKINGYLTAIADVTLDDIYSEASEVFKSEYSWQPFAFGKSVDDLLTHALALMGALQYPIRVHKFEWDAKNKRHYFTVMSPRVKVLMFSRDPLRDAGFSGVAINKMEVGSIDFLKDLGMTKEELPSVLIEEALNDDGEHKYFSVVEAYAPEMSEETANRFPDDEVEEVIDMDDIPF